MNRLSFFIILILSIACTSLNAFAAPMKYSFEFYLGAGCSFNSTPLAESTIAALHFYGDTDDIDLFEGSSFIRPIEGDLFITGIGTYALEDPWQLTHFVELGPIYVLAEIDLVKHRVQAELSANYSTTDFLFQTIVIDDISNGALGTSEPIQTTGGEYFGPGIVHRYSQTAVPIPGSMLFLSSGLALLIGFRRKFTARHRL